MSHLYGIGKNGFSTREEILSSVPVASDRAMVCPKPRRLGVVNPSCVNNIDQPVRSLRWNLSHQVENCDSRPATDFLDIILAKGGGCSGVEQLGSAQIIASSPPFFCGSPPSRVANPLIQDVRFGDEKFSPLSPSGGFLSPPSSPNSSARKGGGFVGSNFGNKPVVRIEGFDCLDRDRRNCSIPAWA